MESDTGAFAIILAGGRSARMGRDKAALPLGDTTLLERVAAELHRAFSPIIVVAARSADQPSVIDAARDLILVRDEVAYQGPVHALRAGLRAGGGDHAFVASCDLPLVRAEVALKLCAMLENHDAVIARLGGRLQMLHAVYRRHRCLAVLDAMETRGERRLHAIVDQIKARIVEDAEMRLIDPRLESFFNVNTPQDYRAALAAIARS